MKYTPVSVTFVNHGATHWRDQGAEASKYEGIRIFVLGTQLRSYDTWRDQGAAYRDQGAVHPDHER